MGRGPKAEVEVTAQSRGLAARLREAKAKFGKFGGELKREVFGKDLVEKGFLSKAGAQMVGNLGSSAATAIGGFVVDQGRDVLKFNDELKRLEILSNSTPEEMARFGRSVRATSSEVGKNASELLSGAQAYVALTGDIQGAIGATRQWGRVAQAENANVEDIAKTAAALSQQMKIGPEDMERSFSALAVQGKLGAIELKDLATQLSSIAPQWAEFGGGKGVQGVKELGAALQVVKRGFGGDAGETITGLQSLLNAIVKHAPQLQHAGVKVFQVGPDGVKHLRNALDIVNDMANSKLAKDPTKMEKALGRVEAYRAYLQLRDNRDELNKMVAAASDAGVIQRDLDKYLQSSAGRTQVAWQKAKNEIADAFTPERIETFTRLVVQGTKALAAMAAGASAVLGLVEDTGKGLAILIGGKSEDDRATEASNAHRAERVELKKRHMRALGEARGSEADIDQAARAAVTDEDASASMLAQGKRMNGSDQGYSREELVALRGVVDKSGMTNTAGIDAIIDGLLAKMDRNQQEFLRNFGDVTSRMQIMVGGNPIMTAVVNAPQNARRPSE